MEHDAVNDVSEGNIVSQQDEEEAATEDCKVCSLVVSVDTDQALADGLALVTIQEEDGMEVIVAIRSMGNNFVQP